jgi:hypothetical protein
VSVGDPAVDIHARVLEDGRKIYDAGGPLVSFSTKSPAGNRCSRASVAEKPNQEWNTLELICVGGRSTHVVNGVIVMQLENSRRIGEDGKETPLIDGRIQFQCEGAELFIRDIEIMPAEKLFAERSGQP